MPHRRSENKYRSKQEEFIRRKQEYAKRRLVRPDSYRDRDIAETICLADADKILEMLRKEFEGVFTDIAEVEKGEVIVDSRGEGSFQRLVK